VDLVAQDLDHDAERGVVGDAATLKLFGRQAGGGHRAIDRLAAAVDQDGPQADGLHEHDVLQGGVQGGGVFHGATAELDHGAAAAEGADVVERLDERFGLAERVVHRHGVRRGSKRFTVRTPPGNVNAP